MTARVGILVLNYHQPAATLDCIRGLLAAEGPETRILWIENDARAAAGAAEAALRASGLAWTALDPARDPLPPAGTIGLLANAGNFGYGGGNNTGLRYLAGQGVPFAWVLNNDAKLLRGHSGLLAEAAEARPEVGLWATALRAGGGELHCGGEVRAPGFHVRHLTAPGDLERLERGFASGASLFLRTATARAAGWIPEQYFLYYEDLAFSFEVRRLGLKLACCAAVEVEHRESLSTGRRSPLVEYYNRRNRWLFIRTYFPAWLAGEQRRFLLLRIQALAFRFKFRRIALEWAAWRDFRRGLTGRAERQF